MTSKEVLDTHMYIRPQNKTTTIQRRAKQAKEKNLFTYFIKSEICGVNKNAEFCGCCFSFRATKLQLCYFDSTFEVDAKN